MRILVGLSGGVDSTAAALLLKEKGHTPVGVYLRLNPGDSPERAAECAESLGLEFHSPKYYSEFEQLVKEPFCRSFLQGETPNPCVICNKEIKFGVLQRLAEEYSCEKMATGHYVQKETDPETGRPVLYMGSDEGKDQSYFLWQLSAEQLKQTEFPLGKLTKAQVRVIAEKAGLPSASSKDSQDICFIPEGDCGSFIAEFTGILPVSGPFMTREGTVLGQHRGLCRYTIGQRKGLGISAETPLYVLEKRVADNAVIVGKEEELYYKTVFLRDINWQQEKMDFVWAKLRYSRKTASARFEQYGNGGILLFDEPQRAPSPGQSAVLYDGRRLLGGGIISGFE